jgi:hypothetical protein
VTRNLIVSTYSYSSSIITRIKSESLRLTGHVIRMGEKKEGRKEGRKEERKKKERKN